MRSLADLQKEANALGLKVPEQKAKAPYITALRDFYLKRDFPSGPPYEELCPMQCFEFYDLNPKVQKELWKSSDWVCQQKMNGTRVILHFKRGLGVFAHSRHVSEVNFRRSDLTGSLPFKNYKPDFDAVVDAEQVGDQFHVFDIVRWNGADLRKRKLSERLGYLDEFRKGGPLPDFLQFPAVVTRDKKVQFDALLAFGAEGVVFKHLDSRYEDNSSRSRRGWVKLKRQLEFDAYVSGFTRGRPGSKYENLVASVAFTVQAGTNRYTIARVSSLPWVWRKEISQYDRITDTLKLDVSIYGRVARVVGLEMSRKSFRLSHARIENWRTDLFQENCKYALDDLKALRSGQVGVVPIRMADASN